MVSSHETGWGRAGPSRFQNLSQQSSEQLSSTEPDKYTQYLFVQVCGFIFTGLMGVSCLEMSL